MPLDIHTIETPDGAAPNYPDRVVLGVQTGVANAAGGSAGAAVATAVAGFVDLPANYAVLVSPGQSAAAWITNKTSTAFTVNLVPLPATATLAAGTFDLVVVG